MAPRTLDADALRAWRMRSQGLRDPRPASVAEAVRRAGAIQAQDTPSSRLGVRARAPGLTQADVVRACNDERSVVRSWLMRGTIHMVPIEDARWMTALLGPWLAAKHATRRRQLGLDDGLAARAFAAMRAVLAGRGPLTRDDLMDAVIARGVPVDTRDGMPAHIVYLGAFRGLVCRGPDPPSGGSTVALADDWLPPGPARETDAALAELALRFVSAYAPVGPRDLAYWSGLPAPMARRAMDLVADRLDEVRTPGGAWLVPAGSRRPAPAATHRVRLLPAFDGALLGHRDRTPLMGERPFTDVTAGSWILPSVLVDGRIAGVWRPERAGGRLTVRVTPLDPLDDALLPGLRAEADDVGRFLGMPAALEVGAS